jgi:hypothetical protein
MSEKDTINYRMFHTLRRQVETNGELIEYLIELIQDHYELKTLI